MKKEESGITLIALVVTIIVLLILAGVAISLTIGNNGLFIRAGGAANTWRKAEANEQGEMSNFEKLYDNTLKDVGLGEKEDIEFTINDTPYTVKDGTTWNEFFSTTTLSGEYWGYFADSRGEIAGLICKHVKPLTYNTDGFSYLRDELGEKQHKDTKIESKIYKTIDYEDNEAYDVTVKETSDVINYE